jgi:hypothetical protein
LKRLSAVTRKMFETEVAADVSGKVLAFGVGSQEITILLW